MFSTQELSSSHISLVAREAAQATPGSYFAQAQSAELAILIARRDVAQASRSLEASKRTLMTSDIRHGNAFMIVDSHKIIVWGTARLAQAQATLAQAYAGRMPVQR